MLLSTLWLFTLNPRKYVTLRISLQTRKSLKSRISQLARVIHPRKNDRHVRWFYRHVKAKITYFSPGLCYIHVKIKVTYSDFIDTLNLRATYFSASMRYIHVKITVTYGDLIDTYGCLIDA